MTKNERYFIIAYNIDVISTFLVTIPLVYPWGGILVYWDSFWYITLLQNTFRYTLSQPIDRFTDFVTLRKGSALQTHQRLRPDSS